MLYAFYWAREESKIESFIMDLYNIFYWKLTCISHLFLFLVTFPYMNLKYQEWVIFLSGFPFISCLSAKCMIILPFCATFWSQNFLRWVSFLFLFCSDLASWLGVEENGLFNFKPSVRPVPLEVHIQARPPNCFSSFPLTWVINLISCSQITSLYLSYLFTS